VKFSINHKKLKQKIAENRIVFFSQDMEGEASRKADTSELEEEYISSIEARAKSPESPKWMKDNLGIIAKKARSNKMSLKLLRKIVEAINRGDKYTGSQVFQDFILAIARSDLTQLKEKGEGMFFFADRAIKGSERQKAAAKIVIEKYAYRERHGQKIRRDDFERYTNIIRDAELYDDLSHIRQLVYKGEGDEYESSVREIAKAITETADTHAEVEETISIQKGTVVEEQFPASTMETLAAGAVIDKKLMDELTALRNRAIPIDRQLDQLHEEGNKDPKRVRELKREQSRLNKQIAKLERKRQQLIDKMDAPQEARLAHDIRMVKRYEACQYMSEKLGFDVSKPDTKITCTLENGQQVEREIIAIVFHSSGKNVPADAPLTPHIVYEEDGKRMGPPHRTYLDFIRDIIRDNGHVELTNLDQVNEVATHETAGEGIKAHQQFTSTVNGTTFTITNISKDGQITLDHSVVTKHANDLRLNTTPDEKWHDTKQQTLSFGQFAQLLRSKSYRRSDIGTDDLPEAARRIHEALRGRCEKLNKALLPQGQKNHIQDGGLPPENGFVPPMTGETASVYLIHGDQVFQEQWTPSLDENGQTVYNRKRVRLYPYSPRALLGAGVPTRFASKKNPIMDAREIDLDSPTGKYAPLAAITANRMLDMVRDGNVMNVPPSLLKQHPNAGDPSTVTVPGGPAGHFKLDPNANKGRALAVSEEKFDVDAGGDMAGAGAMGGDMAGGEEEDVPNTLGSNVTDEMKHLSVVPYNQAHKIGGMTFEQESYLKTLWADTRVFSVMDFWEMGKSMWEYYDRRFDRKQKEKYSSVGKHLPFFSPEMQRINQSAENEEVNQFKETFEEFGALQIQERLRISSNQDEVKAAFQVLSDKGHLRWDDVQMWKNFNQFVSASNKIPIPVDGDPYRIVSDDPNSQHYNRNGFDYLKTALDSVWGEGSYDGWKNSNQSNYASKASSYEEEGKELGNVAGSHTTRLGELLRKHKAGEFVDPHRYEGLILHAIRDGKATMQAKLFYIIEGVAAVNSQGRTLMSFDRVAHIEGNYIAAFPILEHFTSGAPDRATGESVPYTLQDFKKWVHIFDDGEPGRYQPGRMVNKFLWDQVITSETTKTRINKALRNAEGIDHDDYYAYLPPATEQQITDATKGQSGGGKKFLTVEGYKNCFPGFSQLMRTFTEKGESKKLAQAIVSYVRFESIMADRFEKGNDTYQRLDDEMDRNCVMAPHPPSHFQGELNALVDGIVHAYANEPGGAELVQVAETMRRDVDIRILNTPDGKRQQDEVNAALKRFNSVFTNAVNQDGGSKLMALVGGADRRGQMTGMDYNSAIEIAKGKAKSDD